MARRTLNTHTHTNTKQGKALNYVDVFKLLELIGLHRYKDTATAQQHRKKEKRTKNKEKIPPIPPKTFPHLLLMLHLTQRGEIVNINLC